jgi:acylphosphatase
MVDERKALRWVLIGRVQGVGFRYFARQVGESMGVKGWVRNLPDGTVEVQVCGTEEQLGAFKDELMRGSRGAEVEDIEEESLIQVPRWQSFWIVF